MNRFPSTEELLPLLDAELTQIVLDPYQVRFVLSGRGVGATLSVSETFCHLDHSGETTRYHPDRGGWQFVKLTFHALMLKVITTLETTSDGGRLTIGFLPHGSLQFSTTIDGPYESGTLALGGDRFRLQGLWVF